MLHFRCHTFIEELTYDDANLSFALCYLFRCKRSGRGEGVMRRSVIDRLRQ